MTDQRLEQTIQRIERALARIAAAADAAASERPGVPVDLAERHAALRKQVRAQLERLDNVIGEVER
ncbi:hypothetical protein [Alteriqipengyuania lutimaris]|uniref:Uncharacterized protein n=1 Tax=Alteriqipengyuania lutimaris TaxID=1538146 RepID=A0A395LLH1_9SPHN|nr:hypothetical protein [Alteriqipengyuania lutimaris]MBB3033057.1 hypothetical protein [Alteriqipengyuania lutimaris]RDS77873.1 hypothetical protein DL238_09865 [Alteriqipengyuania lutimaris]